MEALTIRQVAEHAGVRPSTLRYYESIGLLMPSHRVHGQRRYDPAVLQQLGLIQTAQQAGFTLAEIQLLLNDILPSKAPRGSWLDLVQRKIGEVETLLRHAQQMKELLEDVMTCDAPELAECIYSTGQRHKT
jgi:MerR family redox-sensitive transcriptional activator SoxR